MLIPDAPLRLTPLHRSSRVTPYPLSLSSPHIAIPGGLRRACYLPPRTSSADCAASMARPIAAFQQHLPLSPGACLVFLPAVTGRRVSRLPLRVSHHVRARIPPSAHASCHSACDGSATDDLPPVDAGPMTHALSRLTAARDSPPAAVAGAALLAIAAALYLARLHVLLIRVALAACLAFTGLPALADSATRLLRSRGKTLDVDLLMSVAAIVCVATGALFEGALLTTLYAVSHVAEEWTSIRARRALDQLRDVTPTIALRLESPTSSHPQTVNVSDVRRGDFLLVRSGEILPCDGKVVNGAAFVSMQHLTGESNPRHVESGDTVPAGCRPEDAPIVVRVTEIGAETFIARIARLVTAAQDSRPRVSKFFDRFGQLYTRTVFLVSFALALILPFIAMLFAPAVPAISFLGRSGSFTRALSFLVAASPCALLIGGPVAYLAALSSCARRGILVKSGAKSLEAASRVSHVVFDKTGTLTTGRLTLTSAAALPSTHHVASTSTNSRLDLLDYSGTTHLDRLQELEHDSLSKILSAAAALERGAVHPIAAAVQTRAEDLGARLPEVTEARVIAGQGVEGILSFDGADDPDGNLEMAFGRLGRPSYILNGKRTILRSITDEASSRGDIVSVLEVADDLYLLRMRDDVRGESRQIVGQLKDRGMKISVLTGDSSGAAQHVSSILGGGVRVVSDATPQEKLDYVKKLQEKLQKKGEGVLMVGDGVNDAAAMAASLVGVSCGLSSATAVHAADVVLVREDLKNILWFLRKAKATRSVVLQNLVIALGLMVLSAFACIGGAVPLWLAVTLHEGGTILVGINGLRLLRER